MFDLADRWVWDLWVTHDGSDFHLFFLQAPRSLRDPELRHTHASIGHAVSPDLLVWTEVGQTLDPQPPPAFDDLATWTGCVVRADDGGWRMFTTGVARAEGGLVQRIGLSRSTDLMAWLRSPDPLLEADPRWYAVRGRGVVETHWRDPWVLRDASGAWHMLATAQSAAATTAVVAHATSDDLETWRPGPPLTLPSRRFGHAEVVSVQQVDARWVLVFSCLADRMPHDPWGAGGVWSLPVPPPEQWCERSEIDLDTAVRLTTEELYVAKVVPLPEGGTRILAFVNRNASGDFVGGVTDPLPIGWRSDGAGLELRGGLSSWMPVET